MVTLSATLRKLFQAYTEEQFNTLTEAWGVSMVPEQDWVGDTDLLGMFLQEPIEARFAWEGLSKNARDILHQIIVLDIMDGAPENDLQKLLLIDDDEFQKGLVELKELLMVFEDRPSAKVRLRMENRGQESSHVLVVPKESRNVFAIIDNEIYGTGDRSKLKLVDLLLTYELTDLQNIGKLYRMEQHDAGRYFYNNKDGFARSLAGMLVQPSAIELSWSKLDNTAQDICRFLCQTDGNAETDQLRERFDLDNVTLSRSLHLLENHGLVFDTFSGQRRKVFIGRGVLKVLRRTINELDEAKNMRESLTLETLKEIPSLVKEGGFLLCDLAIVVGAVYQQIIEPTQAGPIPKRIANKIAPLLHGSRHHYYDGSDHYLDMVFFIAVGLSLIELVPQTGQKARYMPGPRLTEWRQLTLSQQERRLLNFWWSTRSHSWSDIAGVYYHSDGYGYYLDMHAARRALLEYLVKTCQTDQWYTRSSLLQIIKQKEPLLLRSTSHYSPYESAIQTRRNILDQWDTNDGELITGIMDSTLNELGLVTIGSLQTTSTQQPGNSYAFKLNEVAVKAMEWDESAIVVIPAPTEPKRTLIVQPNFELLLLEPDYTILYQLLPFARVDQVEMVSRLTITQESIRRGVESGWNVERTLQTLQTLSMRELPQNVLYTLQDWSRLYKNATLSQVLLLEVSSEVVADEIIASSKLRTLDLHRLGPCAMVVAGDISLQVLRTTLEKEGVILRVEGTILTAASVNDRWR